MSYQQRYKSGAWEGYYTMAGKKRRVVLDLQFTNEGQMNGIGQCDILGFFNIDGTYTSKPPFSCETNINFQATKENIQLDGWREKDTNGFFGNWKGFVGDQTQGSFALSPNSDSQKAPDIVDNSNSQPNEAALQTLQEFGFDSWICSEALKATGGNIEEAIQWITDKSEQNFGSEDQDSGECSEENIKTLTDMGFERSLCISALKATAQDTSAAVEFLFSND